MSEQTGPSAEPAKPHHQSFWLWVMCLTGVDYFSTLGYQPSIAVQNAGMLAPLATVVLVAITLFGALPVYFYVAGRSFEGQGSIGMLARARLRLAGQDHGAGAARVRRDRLRHYEDALRGGRGRPPHRKPELAVEAVAGRQATGQLIVATMILLILLAATFLRGFREVIGIAVVIVGIYLTLNLIVIGSGIAYLTDHPERWWAWIAQARIRRVVSAA